jgi:5-methylthioadenosine/S-adenosylhomocysteine deaminase
MSLLIENGAVLTMDAASTIHQPGWLWVDGERIADVGAGAAPEALRAAAGRIVNAAGMAVLPGMINGHTHLEQILARGVGDGRPLIRWLREVIWPLEGAMTPEDVYAATRLALLEQIKGGITATVQHHKVVASPEHIEAALAASEEMGGRLLLMRLWADTGARVESAGAVIAHMARLRDRWQGAAGGRIAVGFGPTAPWRCTDGAMRATLAAARAWGLPTHMHVAESPAEVEMLRQRTGMGHIEWLDSLGALGPDMHLVHNIWISDRELDLAAGSGAVLVHCPTSNLYLASGAAPVRKMLDRGIPVTLGTDGAGGGGAQDMFETAKMAVYLAKLAALDPTAMTPLEALRMATANGGRQMGRDDLGRLAPGAAADIVLVRLATPRAVPSPDPASALVYSACATDVHTVLVAGRVLVDAGRVVGVDEDAVLHECAEAARRLRQRAGVTV